MMQFLQSSVKYAVLSGDLFRLCPPYVMPSVTEHVPLHSTSSCKNMAPSSGGCKLHAPSKLGGTNGKDPFKQFVTTKLENLTKKIDT